VRSDETTTAARQLAIAGTVGIFVGIVTRVGQGSLPEAWLHLANSGSPWLLAAFLVGSTMTTDRLAAAAGPVTLLAALVGYYATVVLLGGSAGGRSILIFWGVIAVAGGPIFGLAGRRWRRPERVWHVAAIGLIGGAAVAEGVYLMRILPDAATGVAFAVAGVLAPIVLGRSWRDRALGVAAVVPWLVVGVVAWFVLEVFYGFITRA